MKRYSWLVALLVIAFAALGVLYGSVRHHEYKASASLILQDPQANDIVASGVAASPNYVSDAVGIMTASGGTVLTNAANAMHMTVTQFKSDLSVAISSTTPDQVTVTFTSGTANGAQDGANAELTAYAAQAQASQTAEQNRYIANINRALANLSRSGPIKAGSAADQQRQQLLTLQADVLANGVSTGIVSTSPARPPTSPSGTSKVLLGVIGGVVGLLLGGLAAYLLAARRPRMDNRLDPEVVLDAPLITEISDFRDERLRTKVPARDNPNSAAAEAFRFAVAAVALRQSKTDAVTLAVLSASAGDGRTTAVANMAVTRAREGARVLVIDADLEHQTLTSVLLGDLAPRPGLANLLDGSATIDEAVIAVQLGGNRVLSLLTCGTGQGGDLPSIASIHSRRVLDDLRRRFDLVIIDTPPMMTAAYGARYALDADLRLVVVGHNSDPADLEELSERLSFAGSDVLGYLYNRAPLRHRAPKPPTPTATGGRPGNDRNSPSRLSDRAATMSGSSMATANWVPTVEPAASRAARTSNPAEPTKGR